MSWNGDWHPLAALFPMLGEDELREMAASIAERGQHVPCRMTPDGLGLDGRNRVAACAIANVEPAWEVYEGDPILFIVDINSERRHLTTGQKAMAVAIGLDQAGLRADGRWKRGAMPPANGSASNTAWTKAFTQAGVVIEHAPELANRVLNGKLELGAAYKDADETRRYRKQLKDLGGELEALVDSGVIDLDEAMYRAEKERRLEKLEADIATRVREGGLSIDEAEAIAVQRAEQLAAQVGRIRAALELLTRMSTAPIPEQLQAALEPDENTALQAALAALK